MITVEQTHATSSGLDVAVKMMMGKLLRGFIVLILPKNFRMQLITICRMFMVTRDALIAAMAFSSFNPVFQRAEGSDERSECTAKLLLCVNKRGT